MNENKKLKDLMESIRKSRLDLLSTMAMAIGLVWECEDIYKHEPTGTLIRMSDVLNVPLTEDRHWHRTEDVVSFLVAQAQGKAYANGKEMGRAEQLERNKEGGVVAKEVAEACTFLAKQYLCNPCARGEFVCCITPNELPKDANPYLDAWRTLYEAFVSPLKTF